MVHRSGEPSALARSDVHRGRCVHESVHERPPSGATDAGHAMAEDSASGPGAAAQRITDLLTKSRHAGSAFVPRLPQRPRYPGRSPGGHVRMRPSLVSSAMARWAVAIDTLWATARSSCRDQIAGASRWICLRRLAAITCTVSHRRRGGVRRSQPLFPPRAGRPSTHAA